MYLCRKFCPFIPFLVVPHIIIIIIIIIIIDKDFEIIIRNYFVIMYFLSEHNLEGVMFHLGPQNYLTSVLKMESFDNGSFIFVPGLSYVGPNILY